MNWLILLGYCGPTDCCLVLCNPHTGKDKQYGIESLAWQLCEAYWDINAQRGAIPEKVAQVIWDNCDKDIFS